LCGLSCGRFLPVFLGFYFLFHFCSNLKFVQFQKKNLVFDFLFSFLDLKIVQIRILLKFEFCFKLKKIQIHIFFKLEIYSNSCSNFDFLNCLNFKIGNLTKLKRKRNREEKKGAIHVIVLLSEAAHKHCRERRLGAPCLPSEQKELPAKLTWMLSRTWPKCK
jgi:hypothetical protein